MGNSQITILMPMPVIDHQLRKFGNSLTCIHVIFRENQTKLWLFRRMSVTKATPSNFQMKELTKEIFFGNCFFYGALQTDWSTFEEMLRCKTLKEKKNPNSKTMLLSGLFNGSVLLTEKENYCKSHKVEM